MGTGPLTNLCILLTLFQISVSLFTPFDCRRPGITCKTENGQKGDCQISGECACPNTAFIGYDCGLETATLKTAGCTVTCGDNGQCFTDGTGDKCRCEAGYYGTNCDRKRVDVIDCTGNRMRVNVNPIGDFKGKIFVSMLSKTSACLFTPVSAGSDLEGYEITLSLSTTTTDNPCASQLKQAGATSTYDVIVQYNSDYLARTDEKHTLSCSDGGAIGIVGTVVSSGGLDGADLAGLTGTEITQTSLSVPVRMQVVDEVSKIPVSSVIRVGDRLALEITMDTSTAGDYVEFFVDSCSSFNQDFNAVAGTDMMEKVLVMNRCPEGNASDVVSGYMSKTGSTVSLPFTGFKFDGFDSLYMSCSVKLCRAADKADCAPINCGSSAIANGYGRKRRQATEDDNNVNVTRRVFVVTFGDDSVMGSKGTSRIVEKELCVESVTFIATAAVFGIVLLVALAVSLALCIRSNRKRPEKNVMGKA